MRGLVRGLSFVPAGFVSRSISKLVSNRIFNNYLINQDKLVIKRLKKLDNILVISDANIGDSVNLQCVVEALRYYFPESRIDYVCSCSASPLVAHNPEISNLYPVFNNGTVLSKEDFLGLKNVIDDNSFDLIINFCPFISKRDLSFSKAQILTPVKLILNVLKALEEGERAHIIYKVVDYINDLVSMMPGCVSGGKRRFDYKDSKIYLKERTLKDREEFLGSQGISIKEDENVIFFNPDTSNSYTFIEVDLQVRLIEDILVSNRVDLLFLGSGFSFVGIEEILFSRIRESLRDKVFIVSKSLAIDVYASIIDMCDLFITGDTGQMHIASAKKCCVDTDEGLFRNKTGIVSIFGATDARIYGYDDFASSSHMHSSQDAAAKVFESKSECKSLVCSLQRLTKSCKKRGCFLGLELDMVVEHVLDYLGDSNESVKVGIE